ncbi:MAG TPA: protein kinase [Armatimonadota bacterium]|nr:protein kinase [Armatimonadota bacterium]
MSLGKIGKYEKLDVLGHGVSGIVYLAWDTLLGRHVALKEVNLQAEDEQRFIEEARVLDRLRHPNIVRVNSVDKIDGQLIIDMEYVKGANLQKYMRQRGRLSVREALSIAVQICDALDFAHGSRTVHRDIKPANILISREGVAKIGDFGLAEILASGSYAGGAGTYAYMAPEDFAEEEGSDHRSDIWSVGVTVHEMLTGRRPFQAVKPKDPFSWKRAVEEDEIPPLSEIDPPLSSRLEQVISRALAKNKRERYQSAAGLRSDLENILASVGGLVALGGAMDQRATAEPALSVVSSPNADEEYDAAVYPAGISIRPERLDFGRVRRGETGSLKVTVRVPGLGRIAGRVASQPGWLSVSPQAFHRRKQVLSLTADTESIWEPGAYNERLVLDVGGEEISIPVSVTVLAPRKQFYEIAWWYLPLFVLCLVPLAAGLFGGGEGARTPALVATGLLSVMVFIISVVADLGILEKLLPGAVGAIGLGAVIGAIAQITLEQAAPSTEEILLTSIVGTPLSLLVALQLLTASRWRLWVVVTAISAICAAVAMME